MNKGIFFISFFLVLIVLVGIYFFTNSLRSEKNVFLLNGENSFDPKNSTFVIEENRISLEGGVSEVSVALDSSTKLITRYFGNEANGDLNGDDLEDIVFLVTQDGGGSGLFYYVVVALKTIQGYKTTKGFFIGDRIAPQSIEIYSEELNINYADRKPGEPMINQPSIGVTKTLKLNSDEELEIFNK